MDKKEINEIKEKLNYISNQIINLDVKLSKHINFIEKVYMPLQKSIDKFKRIFK